MSPSIRWRKASEVAKRRVTPATTGGTFVDKAEKAVKDASQGIVQHYDALAQYLGERPYGTKKLSERQQVRRYLLVRDNPEAWTGLLRQKGTKATVQYAMRMERLLEKYPDEASYLNPEPLEVA